jgi:hypothetical protein
LGVLLIFITFNNSFFFPPHLSRRLFGEKMQSKSQKSRIAFLGAIQYPTTRASASQTPEIKIKINVFFSSPPLEFLARRKGKFA